MASYVKSSGQYLKAYQYAFDIHGDLGLGYEVYGKRLDRVIEKYMPSNGSSVSPADFIEQLHTADLYLSTACAISSERAWASFEASYREFIYKIAVSASASVTSGLELAGSLMGHIYLPDASGHARIASYEGRSTLAAWLTAVITNRAIKERERKCNNVEPLEAAGAVVVEGAVEKVFKALASSRYKSAAYESLKEAVSQLEPRERLMLLLRYEDRLTGLEIAGLVRVHPSTISRQLRRVEQKLRAAVLRSLASRYGSSSVVIEEVAAEALEDPICSIISLLKES
jgi:RNA polymerase sigma-70 factor